MNALTQWIPRADAGAQPVAVDLSDLGAVSHADNLTTFGNYGTELGRAGLAKEKIGQRLARHWHLDISDRKVQDAAADFVTSSLERVLGPGEDIVLNDDQPFIFVPRPGRPLALESRSVLPPGWRTNSYKVKTHNGQATWVEPHAVRKVGYADFQEEKKEQGAEYYAIKYCYTIPEQWENNILNVDEIGEREFAATQALDNFRERVSGFGDANKKIPGLWTSGDAVIANGGQQFSSGAVGAQIMMSRLANFNRLYTRINRERPANMLTAPWTDLDAMQNTYFGTGGEGPSVWDRAIERYDWLRNAVWTDRLANANATANASRWAVYSRNSREMYLEHTESMVFGPFQDYMNFDFVVIRRIGGLVNKRPERLMYVDFTRGT